MSDEVWVLTYNTNDLQSVENISSGLVRLYSKSFRVRIIELQDPERMNSGHLRKWLDDYKANPPGHVAVVHPSVNHHPFFQALLVLKTNTKFLIHVFGNFIRNGESWKKQEHLFLGRKVHFISASECYDQVVQNFIPAASCALLPFPVIDFAISERKEKPNDSLQIIYTGRYHEQKNVSLMIEKLNETAGALKIKVELILAVVFDDFNPTTMNKKKLLGEQFSHFQDVKRKSGNLTITIIPHTSLSHLKTILASSDLFISFSTFQDEDFGCSVLEALACGVPCLVTKWGGFRDFIAAFPDACIGIDVFLKENSLVADLSHLPSQIVKLVSLKDKKSLQEDVKKQYSDNSLMLKLKFIAERNEVFSGFTGELKNIMTVDEFKKLYQPFWSPDGK